MYYEQADVYVFIADPEENSIAMATALGYGLPIVTSNEPGTREMFNDNGFWWI